MSDCQERDRSLGGESRRHFPCQWVRGKSLYDLSGVKRTELREMGRMCLCLEMAAKGTFGGQKVPRSQVLFCNTKLPLAHLVAVPSGIIFSWASGGLEFRKKEAGLTLDRVQARYF